MSENEERKNTLWVDFVFSEVKLREGFYEESVGQNTESNIQEKMN